MSTDTFKAGSIIAAAGASTRMGQPKMLLDWHGTTVIEAIVQRLQTVGAEPCVCVTGHYHQEIVDALAKTPARCVVNQRWAHSGLLASYQEGLKALITHKCSTEASGQKMSGALLLLSDQPHVPASVFRAVLEAAESNPDKLVFPSHNQKRGHPFYLPRTAWDSVLAMPTRSTMREWVNGHQNQILYVSVSSDAIMHDMDTPQDYERLKAAYTPDNTQH